MSVRVRKLARELDRSPDDVLGLLADHLSLARYSSPEDMLPDEVAAQVRKVAKTAPVRHLEARSRPAPSRNHPQDPPSPAADLMAELVPGVTVPGAPRPARRAPRPPPSAAPAARPPTLGDERQTDVRQALAEERRRLEAARAELAAERAALAAEREALEAARAEAEVARAALRDDRIGAEARLRERTLAGLLERRGLKGADEHGRALAALAAGGHLARLAAELVPSEPDVVQRLLRERLTLTSGAVPDSVGPVVWVSPERADLRGGAELDRLLSRLSEGWLLAGRRRVVWLGVPQRFHALLREKLDRRVELVLRPGGERTEAQTRDDLASADLLIAWGVAPTPGARALWAAARGKVVELEVATLGEALERLTGR